MFNTRVATLTIVSAHFKECDVAAVRPGRELIEVHITGDDPKPGNLSITAPASAPPPKALG